MNKRIVISGTGTVGPWGVWLDALERRLASARLARSALHATPELGAEAVVSRRLQRKLDPFCVRGMVAANLALQASGLDPQALDLDRVGLYVGNCLGGWAYTQPELGALYTRGVDAMSPYVATAWFPAALQGQLSLLYGFRGHSKTFSARDVAGLQAIGHAVSAIYHGRLDAALCGASEDLSSPYLQAVLQRYELADRRPDQAFGGACASDFADGAAFLVLENLEHARRRRAPVLCEVTGFAERFCSRPEQAPVLLAQALATAEGTRCGERLLLLDGLQRDEPVLADAALREAGLTATTLNPRPALGNQFAVSGVTEIALVAQALAADRLSAHGLGLGDARGGYCGALVQRLSPRGGIAALGLAAA